MRIYERRFITRITHTIKNQSLPWAVERKGRFFWHTLARFPSADKALTFQRILRDYMRLVKEALNSR